MRYAKLSRKKEHIFPPDLGKLTFEKKWARFSKNDFILAFILIFLYREVTNSVDYNGNADWVL